MSTSDDVFCINCRAVIALESPFCTECGTKQPDNPRPSKRQTENKFLPAHEKYCSSCGRVVEIGTPFCGGCGASQSRDTPRQNETPSEWIIGFAPGATTQNIVAGICFYFLLYPIGIPTLVYGYVRNKRQWSKGRALILLVFIGALLLALLVI